MVAKLKLVRVNHIKTLSDLSDIGYEDELNRLCMELALKSERLKIMKARIEQIQNVLREYNIAFNNDERTQKHKVVFGKYGYYIDQDRNTFKVDADKVVEYCVKHGIDIKQFQEETIASDKVKEYFKDDLQAVTNKSTSKGAVKTIG